MIDYQELIKQSVQEQKLYASQQRRYKVEKLIDYYEGGTNTTKHIDDYFESDIYKEIPLYCVNTTKPIIDKLSRVYKNAPIRTVGNSTSNPGYSSLVGNINIFNKNLEKMLRLLDNVAVGVFFDEINSKFNHTAIYYFDAYFDDSNPYTPIAISYPMLNPTGDISYTDIPKFVYYDDKVKVIYDEDGNIISEEENGLGKLPFIFPRVSFQIDDFFGEGATDIVSINEHINITMSEMQLGLRFQMFGYPYVTGMDSETPLQRVGPDKIMQFPEGTNFGIASSSLEMNQVIENIKFQMEMLGKSRHLSIVFESSQDRPSSALALVIKDQDRLEYFKDDVEHFRQYEHDLYKLQRDVAAYNNIYLPEDFIIDFSEPVYPKTTQEEIMQNEFDLKQGFVTPEELLVQKKHDITLDQAREIINKNIQGDDRQEIPTGIQENKE
tara:strand:- start:645 stop:1958 length:1314 start_codon:yes stop_codon:yes gene_type:complete